MKFSMKAKTKVTKNQTSLLRKYFRYPFNATPPYNDNLGMMISTSAHDCQ